MLCCGVFLGLVRWNHFESSECVFFSFCSPDNLVEPHLYVVLALRIHPTILMTHKVAEEPKRVGASKVWLVFLFCHLSIVTCMSAVNINLAYYPSGWKRMEHCSSFA